MKTAVLLASAFCLLGVADATAQSEQRGLNFVQANCARCHSVDKVTLSPLAIAPPFRDLHKRYPVENLAEAFAEGIKVAHPMPQFQLEPGQIEELIAYLKSLER